MSTFAIVITFISLLALFFIGLGEALTPLLLSLLLAYLFFPLIQFLEKRGIARQVALMLVLLVLVVVCGVLGLVLMPILIRETRELVSSLPQAVPVLLDKMQWLADQVGVTVTFREGELKDLLVSQVSNLSGSSVRSLSLLLKGAFQNLSGALQAILHLCMIPLFFFYVINDYERIAREVKTVFPDRWKPYIHRYLSKANRVLSGYVRGQIVVALVLSVVYSLGLQIVGLKYGLAIGLVAGFLNLVPFVGFAVGVLLTVISVVVHSASLGTVMGAVLVFALGQGLEGFYMTPKLVGDRVGLSPFATILALIVGGNLLGFAGVVLAIPIFAIGKTVYVDVLYALKRLNL